MSITKRYNIISKGISLIAFIILTLLNNGLVCGQDIDVSDNATTIFQNGSFSNNINSTTSSVASTAKIRVGKVSGDIITLRGGMSNFYGCIEFYDGATLNLSTSSTNIPAWIIIKGGTKSSTLRKLNGSLIISGYNGWNKTMIIDNNGILDLSSSENSGDLRLMKGIQISDFSSSNCGKIRFRVGAQTNKIICTSGTIQTNDTINYQINVSKHFIIDFEGATASPGETVSFTLAQTQGQPYITGIPNVINSEHWDNISMSTEDSKDGWKIKITARYQPAYAWTGAINTNWNLAGNWKENKVPTATDNVVIPDVTNDPIVNESPTSPAICNNITIYSGASLEVAAGKAFTVKGNINNAGTMTLKATANGTATLLTEGSVGGDGKFYTEQYLNGTGDNIPNGKGWLISSALSLVNSGVFKALGGKGMWWWKESEYTMQEITDDNTVMQPMMGYVVSMAANNNIAYSGESFNNGTYSNLNLTRTGNSNEKRGYHLLGNPYPSYLNWNMAESSNLLSTIWFRTYNGAVNVFDTYNTSSGLGTSNYSNGSDAVAGSIAPNQAFWVRVNADGNTGQLSFNNSMRSHKTFNPNKTDYLLSNVLKLRISDRVSSDEAIVLFNSKSSDDFDSWDSEKMLSNEIAQCYTTNNMGKMAINSLSELSGDRSVPLQIIIPRDGDYSLIASNLFSFESFTDILLEDKTNDLFVDIYKNPTYQFTEKTGTYDNRFVLHFDLKTSINPSAKTNADRIYAFDKTIFINTQTKGEVVIIDLLGKVIKRQKVNAGLNSIGLSTSAIYIVKLTNEKNTTIEKVWISQ